MRVIDMTKLLTWTGWIRQNQKYSAHKDLTELALIVSSTILLSVDKSDITQPVIKTVMVNRTVGRELCFAEKKRRTFMRRQVQHAETKYFPAILAGAGRGR